MGDLVRRASPDDHTTLAPLWEAAAQDVRGQRGGAEFLRGLLAGRTIVAALAQSLASGELWCALDDACVVGFAWRTGDVIAALYVQSDHRRRGLGRALVTRVLEDAPAPRDGYALPGDRATKSLYESIGWKARLLTMRAD